MNEIEAKWVKKIRKELSHAVVIGVRYMTEEEMNAHGWYSKALVLCLRKGNKTFFLYPSTDDEGNNAGALFTTLDDLSTIPVMR